MSSVTPFGTEAAAIAKSSAARSPSEKSGLVRNSHTAASFFSSTPKCSAPSAVCAMQYWQPAVRLATWATRRLKPRSTSPCGSQIEVDRGFKRLVAHRSEEHTSELQSLAYLVCRLLLEKKKKTIICMRLTA